jgi:hypothetical protein
MDFSNYIFRSSFVGQIISVPKPLTGAQIETLAAFRKKDKPLTDKQKKDLISLENKHLESKQYKLNATAQKALNKIVFYEKTGRIKLLENQYLDKGIKVEKYSRDLMSRILGIPLVKDDERKSNDWVTGKRDINNNDVIIDIKSKFSFDTFYDCLIESSNEGYLRQLDSYMDLWNVQKSLLCHVLVDTPLDIVQRHVKRLDYSHNIMNVEGDIRDESIEFVVSEISNLIYTREGIEELCEESSIIHLEWFSDFKEIPEKDRIHMVAHDFDKARIEQRNECIKLAREYMNGVQTVNNIIDI